MNGATLRGYVVRGGDGRGTSFFGYGWTGRGKLRLVRATEGGVGYLIVMRFPPTTLGRMRAHLVAMAIEGTVKRIVVRRPAPPSAVPPEPESP